MRQLHRYGCNVMRSLAVAVLAVAVLGAAGCSWFRHKSDVYKQSAENRPLEIPPDLDMPNTQGAVQLPAGQSQAGQSPAGQSSTGQSSTGQSKSVTRSSMQAPAGASTTGFTVSGDRDSVYTKVGDALAAIDGVTIASKAQLLGAYDLSYEGADFLVRVSQTQAGAYVSVVDPRGQPATAAAPAKLIKALQAALGG